VTVKATNCRSAVVMVSEPWDTKLQDRVESGGGGSEGERQGGYSGLSNI